MTEGMKNFIIRAGVTIAFIPAILLSAILGAWEGIYLNVRQELRDYRSIMRNPGKEP